MNKGKFPHDKKQKPAHGGHGHGGSKPQWQPGQNPDKHPGHEGHNPNKPQWPGQKDKR